MRIFPAILAALWSSGAFAAGDALVIGNSRYGAFDTLFGATRVEASAEAMREQGFDVAAVQDADAVEMRSAFADFVRALEGDDGPVVVILAGAFLHGPGGAYLLPVTQGTGGNEALALTEGFPIDAVLAVLARYPGRALLVLGETAAEPEGGLYLTPGPGALDVPQGVTVLRGPAADVARFATRELMRPGRDLPRQATRYELELMGYAPEGFVLLREEDVGARVDPDPAPEPDPEPVVDEAGDNAAWTLAQAGDSAEAYRTYLQKYPDGLHSAAARQRLAAIEDEPFYAERRAEERLNLTRDQRREIQRDLSLLGYNTRGIDGIFGPGTRSAIRSWQERAREPQSGYLSAAQIARLDAQAARRAAELEEEARRKQAEQEAADRAFWSEVEAQGDEASLRAYLDRYPEGIFAEDAQALLDQIDQRRADQAALQDRRDWDEAQEDGSVEAYRAYLSKWPSGAFSNEAEARIRRLQREAEQDSAAVRAKAEEDGLNLNPVARRLAEARLSQLGLNPGNVDGSFDRDTRRAIRKYQETRGLRVSGYLDEQTVVRLLADGVLGGR
ncbi:peptidoglycan-binding protein [Tropicibacter alexandrii]|uniref:peptidoglycan-binding protein n=1 Tax=Tropicibacter alexandrii TaxID=2267683 RepID=UPI001008DFE4|nr:peptidoglycan-binding protein [Tropicibacter alexandrii]